MKVESGRGGWRAGREGKVRGREGKRGERWKKEGRARREDERKRGEGYTFDLEVLCHETCYVYTAMSRLQEERHCQMYCRNTTTPR